MTKEITRFEYFEQGFALMGVKIGAVSVDMLIKYDAYKTYLEFLSSGDTEAKAKIHAAKKCRCDPSSIARHIYWFERDDDVRRKAAARTKSNLQAFAKPCVQP